MNKLFKIITCLMLLTLLFGCKKNDEVVEDNDQDVNETINYDIYPKVMFDYVVEILDYGYLKPETAYSYINSMTSSDISEQTSIYKTVLNDSPEIARSYDSYLTERPVYIYVVCDIGCYRSINLTYLPDIGKTFEDLENYGYDQDFKQTIPFLASDVLNIAGLYIGANNLMNEYDDNGNVMFASTGTNPEAEESIPLVSLPRYLADRCATVDEALELVNEINIYSLNENGVNFNYSFILADASGEYGVLEIANNEIYWNDLQDVQTNFYINDGLYEKQSYRNGIGRYDYVNENINNISDHDELYNLIISISYDNLYEYENCPYDLRTDLAGLYYDTSDYLLYDKKAEDLNDYFKKRGETYNALKEYEIREDGTYITSIFKATFNCADLTVNIKFFDDNNRTLSYTLEP